MSHELATVAGGSVAAAEAPLAIDIVEKVVIQGDLSRLSPQQKLDYYQSRCHAAGIDIRTRPFEYLVLDGRLVLYAAKSCTDSLIGKHGLTVEILKRERDEELQIYSAEARVTFPSGRFVEDIGVTPVAGLAPKLLANAMMKAVTKAKRRAVLSACGLGDMMDESEIETLVNARPATSSGQPVRPQNNSGSKTGQYASDDQTTSYIRRLSGLVAKRNAEWLDRWMDTKTGEMPEGLREPLEIHEVDREALRWCVDTGRLDPLILPEEVKARQLGRYVAIVYHRSDSDREALREAIDGYIESAMKRRAEAVYRAHPELRDPYDAGDASQEQTATEPPELDIEDGEWFPDDQ